MLKRLSAIAVLGVILSIALSSTARAEQCSEDGKICLVTDTSQPIVTPATLELRVTSEATSFGVNGEVACSRELVYHAPPGGMNIWSVGLCPASSDGTVYLRPSANGPNHLESSATFAVPVLAASANEWIKMRRTRNRVVLFYGFEARTTIKAVVQIWLNAFPKGETIILTRRGTSQVVGPGTYVVKAVLPRKVIKRRCRAYNGCFALGYARTWVGEDYVDSGTAIRKRVYRKRKHAKRGATGTTRTTHKVSHR